MIKPLTTGACALALLSLISFPPPVQAQATHAKANSSNSQEGTLRGTVSSVLAKSSPGTIPGSHLLLSTAAGSVEASLGRFGLQGKGALAVAAGDEVEVTGVMRTVGDAQVFVARTVTAHGHVYTIRTERGVPVSPQMRERLSAGQKPAQFGRGL